MFRSRTTTTWLPVCDMRAFPENVRSEVAVPAEHLVAGREASLLQGAVLPDASPVSLGSPLGVPSTIDVVESQEHHLVFSAAGASGRVAAVGDQRIHLLFLIPSSLVRPELVAVVDRPPPVVLGIVSRHEKDCYVGIGQAGVN